MFLTVVHYFSLFTVCPRANRSRRSSLRGSFLKNDHALYKRATVSNWLSRDMSNHSKNSFWTYLKLVLLVEVRDKEHNQPVLLDHVEQEQVHNRPGLLDHVEQEQVQNRPGLLDHVWSRNKYTIGPLYWTMCGARTRTQSARSIGPCGAGKRTQSARSVGPCVEQEKEHNRPALLDHVWSKN